MPVVSEAPQIEIGTADESDGDFDLDFGDEDEDEDEDEDDIEDEAHRNAQSAAEQLAALRIVAFHRPQAAAALSRRRASRRVASSLEKSAAAGRARRAQCLRNLENSRRRPSARRLPLRCAGCCGLRCASPQRRAGA